MKKLIALLMAGVMLFSFAACGGNDEEETTTNPEEIVTDAPANADGEEATDGEEETTEEVTEVVTDASGETVTDKDGKAVTEVVEEEKTEKEESTKKTEDSKKPTAATTEDPSKWSTAEVLKYYQDATAKVASKKPGYTKTRSTELGGYDAGAALQMFKDIVFEFLGIGSENTFKETVKKGTNTNDEQCGDYLKKSTLTASDVKSAKAVKSGSNYVITINVKDGTSQTEGGKNQKNNSPIDKSGICVGEKDRTGFDHKSAPLCYAAIGGTFANTTMYEKTNNGKVVATVNAATGEITKLVISWSAEADLDAKIPTGAATIKGTTTVTYTNFGW